MPALSLPALCTGYRRGGSSRKIGNFPGNLLQSGSKIPGSGCKTAAATGPPFPPPCVAGWGPPG